MKAKPVNKSEVNKDDSATITTEFEVVKEFKVGRPIYLTARRFISICKLIETGDSTVDACRKMLVHYTSLRKHVQANPKYHGRLKKAQEVRDEVWRDRALAVIRDAMPKNWVAAMTYLERKYPNEFALRTVNRNLNSTDQPIGDKVDENQLHRYAALMDEFQKGNSPTEQKEITSE
jgi:4-aminobutyrate aminotransferase-like enzyme